MENLFNIIHMQVPLWLLILSIGIVLIINQSMLTHNPKKMKEDLPIISANPRTIHSVLEKIINILENIKKV